MDKLSPSSPLTDYLSEFLQSEVSGKGPGGQNGRLETTTSLSRSGLDGLGHLSKLLGVMERMGELREANQQLRQKCAYLEDTKMLLRVQNIQLLMEQSQEESGQKRRSKTGQSRKGSAVVHGARSLKGPRRNSTDARRGSLAKMHQQRSQSVSSICELVDLDLSRFEDGSPAGKPEEPEKRKDPRKSRASEERRSLKLQEKWKQVKKVFSGKSEAASRAEHGAVSAELLLRTNSRRASRSSTQSLNKSSSCSVSGELSSHRLNQSILLSPVIQGVPLMMDEEPLSPRTPSIILAESSHPRSNSLQVSSIASDSLSKNSCSEISEGCTVAFSQGDESDDSAFTPWVQRTPTRRQSSPLMSVSEPPPRSATTTGDLLSVDSTSVHLLGRSSSFKVTKAAPEVAGDDPASKSLPSTPIQPTQTSNDANPQLGHTLLSPDAIGRKTKGPWGMVKDIIQTRRESLKSKNGKAEDDDDAKEEEASEDIPAELGPTPRTPRKLNSRKMSVTPNLPMRFTFFKNSVDTSPLPSLPTSAGGKRYSLSSTVMSPGSPVDLATLFGVNVNDEFTKKMLEWEEKKKKNVTKGSPLSPTSTTISGSTKFSEDFIRKMEQWELKKGIGGCKPGGGQDGASPCRTSPEGSGHPLSPPTPHPASGEELQRFLSESFSRTVQDWEAVRRRHSQSKERDKSKKVRSVSRERDKSQQRMEKQLKKIQKKERKLEEELRKLAELRLKLDQQLESSSASDKTAAAEALMKGDGRVSPRGEDRSTQGSGGTPRFRTSRSKKESPSCGRGREEAQSEGAHTAPTSPSAGSRQRQSASLSQSSLDSMSSVGSQSPGNAELTRSREGSPGRCRRSQSDRDRSTSYRRTFSSPGSGAAFKGKAQQETDSSRRTEEQLRRRVEEKEEEAAALQSEVRQLTNQINNLNKVYSETIDQFQRELWSSSRLGQQVIQSDEVSIILSQLTNRLDVLQQHGDRMAKEINHTQTKICKEANNRRQTEQQLLHNLEQLHWIIEGPAASSSLAEVVIHLCSYVTKLLSKASVLRQCISERNLLIQELERHLLVQEVINKLLQADIERHAIELNHLKEFQRMAVIKRWKTFNGCDYLGREEQTPEMSRSQHEPVFPKIPQSSKKVQTLLTQMVNDPESLDVDADWLATIKKNAELALNLVTRGIQTDCFIATPQRTTKLTANANVQTVMTFCDCDYAPAQLPSPSDPFRRVAASASPRPPLLITPSCNSPSSNRTAISVDKCLLFPGSYAEECDRNGVDHKPRKSSAPDCSTADGENPVWLRASAFRAISSSYSDRIQDLDKRLTPDERLTPHDGASNAHHGPDSVVDVPSTKNVKNFKTSDRLEPQGSGFGNEVIENPLGAPHSQPLTHKAIASAEDSFHNQTIVEKLSSPSAHSPVIHSKCPWKQKRANAQLNQRRESGRLSEASSTRSGLTQSGPCNAYRYIDDEEQEVPGEVDRPGEEDTDVVFGSSEDSFCWHGNFARLEETQIDESCCDDIPETPEEFYGGLDRSSPSRRALGISQSLDQRRAGSWSSGQDPEKRAVSTNRPIVVRKLKSATELMHDCRQKRIRPTSVPDERYRPSDLISLHTKSTANKSTVAQQNNAGYKPLPIDVLSGTSIGSAGFEMSTGGIEDSSGSDAERHARRPDLYPVNTSSEGATPAVSKDCNRFKPITPVLKAAVGGQQTTITAQSSSETLELMSGYHPTTRHTAYHNGSCTSSWSSIPTVETTNFVTLTPPSNRNRSLYVKENAPESPAAARSCRKGSRSQPAPSPRAGSRAAKSMCQALCLQAMSVELTDDSTDSSVSHPFTPHTSSPSPYPTSGVPIQSTSAPVQSTQHEPEFLKGRGNWLRKPKKLFKALK